MEPPSPGSAIPAKRRLQETPKSDVVKRSESIKSESETASEARILDDTEEMASQEELDRAVLRALCEVLEAGDTEYQIEVASVEVTLEKAYARSDTWVVLPHFEEKLQHATGPNITLNALEHSVWMLIKKLLGDTSADQYEGEDDHDRAFEANDRPVVQFPENAVAFTHDGLPEGDRYHIQLYEDFVKMYGDALSFEEWLSPRTQI